MRATRFWWTGPSERARYDVEHLQLLSVRSLRTLLEQAGFQAVEIRRFRSRYPLRYWLRLAPLGRRATLRLVAGLNRAGLGAVPVTLPAGNLAAVNAGRAADRRQLVGIGPVPAPDVDHTSSFERCGSEHRAGHAGVREP